MEINNKQTLQATVQLPPVLQGYSKKATPQEAPTIKPLEKINLYQEHGKPPLTPRSRIRALMAKVGDSESDEESSDESSLEKIKKLYLKKSNSIVSLNELDDKINLGDEIAETQKVTHEIVSHAEAEDPRHSLDGKSSIENVILSQYTTRTALEDKATDEQDDRHDNKSRDKSYRLDPETSIDGTEAEASNSQNHTLSDNVKNVTEDVSVNNHDSLDFDEESDLEKISSFQKSVLGQSDNDGLLSDDDVKTQRTIRRRAIIDDEENEEETKKDAIQSPEDDVETRPPREISDFEGEEEEPAREVLPKKSKHRGVSTISDVYYYYPNNDS